jgi:glycosyltransferase involved in cell wall biosynthesis
MARSERNEGEDVSAMPKARQSTQPAAPRTKRVVVAMPAYRAARTLEKTVNALPADAADALLLVDDASPDDTVAVANRLGLQVRVHPRNLGYGGNQKTCYDEALRLGADVVVLLHPDFQYDPRAVPALVAPIMAGRADFTFGSRFAGGADPRLGGMPLYRYVGNKLTTMLMNVLLGTQFTETHSGFKAYSRRFLEAAPYRGYSDDFVFDTQILLEAVAGGFTIEEVPIPTRYTEESSSIGIRRSLRYIEQSLLLAGQTRHERRRRRRL